MNFNKIKHCSMALALAFSMHTGAVFSGAMGEKEKEESRFKGHFLAQLGGYSAIQGTPRYIDVANEHFVRESRNQGSGLVGIGFMMEGPSFFDQLFSLDYGVDAFFLGQTISEGTIVNTNTDFTRSFYYRTQNIPLYFLLQSLVNTRSDKWRMVFDGGFGVNFMSLNHYQEMQLNNGYPGPFNAYKDNTPTVFSATAGAALRFSYAPGKSSLECGYRFFYLGNGNFSANNSLVTNLVKTGDNYANALVCSVII